MAVSALDVRIRYLLLGPIGTTLILQMSFATKGTVQCTTSYGSGPIASLVANYSRTRLQQAVSGNSTGTALLLVVGIRQYILP